jgi:hypothetical protein
MRWVRERAGGEQIDMRLHRRESYRGTGNDGTTMLIV